MRCVSAEDAGVNSTAMQDLQTVRARYRAFLAGGPTDKAGIAGRVEAAEALGAVDPAKQGGSMLALARDWYHYRQPESKAAFTRLFGLAFEQGYRKGGKGVGWYGGRNYLKALGVMVEDLDPPYRRQCAEFLFFNAKMDRYLTWDDTHPGGFNTDYLHCDLFGAFGGILYYGDDSEAAHNCRRLKRWLDAILKPSPGTVDFIKADGTSFHHWTHYNAYMYAFTTFADFLYLLRDTQFEIDKESYIRFRNAACALLLMCNGNNYAPTLAGRHPFSTGLPMGRGAYRKLALLGGGILGTGPADPFLARACNRVWPGDDDLAQYGTEPFPTGFWQFNYSPMGIYRQGDWVATLKGMNNAFWGAEIYPGSNRYGRYQGYGVVEILYPGGLAGSGFQAAG